MNDLREILEPGELRVLPVEALSARRGGMNFVRDYWDPRLQRPLVGKIMEPPPELLLSGVRREQWLPQVLLEGQLQQQLAKHPNVMPVVVVLDVVHTEGPGAGPGAVEIFTPLMPCGSAFDVVRTGPGFAADEAVKIVRDAALGLGALHDLGYVHRDVKSPNIFVEATASGPRGLIGDLGLAQPLRDDQTAEGWPQPTPWIAPEQMIPDAKATVASDLFGLAASLVDLVVPFPPEVFDRAAAAARMASGQLPIAARHYKAPPWLPRPIRTLVSTLARPDAAQRTPRTARSAADVLDCTVLPWRQVVISDTRLECVARGEIVASVEGDYRPRLDSWDLAARVDRGNGPRTVATLRTAAGYPSHAELAQVFDSALAAWSR